MGEEIDILTQNVINNRSVTRIGINLVIAEQESILNTISNQVNTSALDADNTRIWLSSENYSIDRLPPEPNPLSQKLNRINFDIPPLFWNENISKKVNIKFYRSKRLKYYDPQLYNIIFTLGGEPTRDRRLRLNYPRICQPTQAQPLAFNTNEKREIDNRVLTFAFDNPENPNMPRIIDWMKYRNVWYLACEFICIGCMLPFQSYDLEDTVKKLKKILPESIHNQFLPEDILLNIVLYFQLNNETYQNCPRCNRSNYVIHNKLGNKQHIRLVPDIRLGPTSNGNRNFSSVYEVWPAIKIS